MAAEWSVVSFIVKSGLLHGHPGVIVTKLSEKSNFETPELKLVSLKHELQARYVIMLNYFYIPCLMFFVTTNWRWKKIKHTKSFGVKFGWNFERFPYFISMLLKITETRFDSEPICYFWINILFQVCVPHVHVNTLNYLLKRHLLPSYHGISRIPVDISRCTSCIRFKLAVTMVRKCGQTCGFTFTLDMWLMRTAFIIV